MSIVTVIIFILGIAMVTASIKGWIDAPRKQSQRVGKRVHPITRSLL